ncbi:MAG: choice-of-anchor Q domain-containing protein [Rubripirellula sp.]|nr:choice-of-anchor Q domain-containing protein [Rubripirellula sp.]
MLSSVLKPLARRSRQQSQKLSRQRRRFRRRRSLFQSLEDRRLLASFSVVDLTDSGDGTCDGNGCTLRDAVLAANASFGEDTITFAPGLAGTITLDSAKGALLITDAVTIIGPDADKLTLRADTSAENQFRVIDIDSTLSDVTLEGMTITGGRLDTNAGAGVRFRSSGTLTLRESVVTGNTANNAAGVYSEFDGDLVITSSTISGNTAAFGDGGGVHNEDGDTTISTSNIENNQSYGSGAGLFSPNSGVVTITDTNIRGNRVTQDGYYGGGVYSGEGDVTISGSTLSGNTADSGGGLYNISGAVSITASKISANNVGYSGGGIFNESGDITLRNVTIEDNFAEYGDGGGVFNDSGAVTLSRSTISGNRAVTDGGGFATGAGRVDIVDSLLVANQANGDGGGLATTTGQITLTNSTLSGNTADGRGGGIQADAAAVRLVNSTVTSNTAGSEGGGIGVIADNAGVSLLLHNSIVAQNQASSAADFLTPNDAAKREVAASVIGNNSGTGLTSDRLGVSGSFIGTSTQPVNAGLLALSDNGGPTLTHAQTAGSPGLDHGDNALAVSFGPDDAPGGGDDVQLTGDQRGGLYQRIVNFGIAATVDIGAFETQSTPQLVVDTNEDSIDGDLSLGDRSLRELVAIANETERADVIGFRFGLDPIELDPALGEIVITKSLTIEPSVGAKSLTISRLGPDPFRLIRITQASDVQLRGLTLTGGDAGERDGGAILMNSTGHLQLVQSQVANNSAKRGGAIAASSGSVSVISSVINDNGARSDGGGISLVSHATALNLVDSTVSGNIAIATGGGIYSEDAAVLVSSSTVTANEAIGAGGGIGFEADGDGESLGLVNSIIAANVAPVGVDFVAPGSAASTLTAQSSLIGNNVDSTLIESGQSPDARGNLIGSAGNPLDAQLGPLADNGGRLVSHLLLEGSLAIDAANAALLPTDDFDLDADGNTLETLPLDQRGAARVVDAPDMGAVELGALPPITWDNPADIVYETLLSPLQLNASSPVSGAYVYTPSAGTLLAAGDAQTLSVVFTPSDPLAFRSRSIDVSVNVLKATPAVTWNEPAGITFGTALTATQLNATTFVAGSFVYDPPAGTILGAGQDQVLSVLFTPNDTANYETVRQTVEIDVAKAVPTINWSDPATIVFGTALDGIQLNATSGIAGAFVYDPIAGTVLNAGADQPLNVEFTPADTANYEVVNKTVEIDVVKAVPVITWEDPATITFGTALDGAQLNASSVVAGSFDYDPVAGTVLNAGADQPLSVEFIPADTTNYTIANKTVEIDVVKAVPVITWGDPATITFGTALDGTQLNASSVVAGSFDYDPVAGTVLNAGADQPLSVEFTPADTTNYTIANKTVEIDVVKAVPVITWDDPATITFGTALDGTQLNATTSVLGTFEYTPVAGTVLNAGLDQPLNVEFTPSNTANYEVANKTVQIDVSKAVPVITWDDPATVTYGTPLGSEQLNASVVVAGTLEYTPTTGTVLDAGQDQPLSVEFTPTDKENYELAFKTVVIDVDKANPVISWDNPADILSGTPLGPDQLNATADIDGTYVYDPEAGTRLPVGADQTLLVTFTPTENTNYNVATANALITVVASFDYGDAPLGYPVLGADDGARHVVGNLTLGATVDLDADGQPSANADADNDDGVALLADAVVDGSSSTTSSFLVTASDASKLDAWIDFNADGVWDDVDEKIYDAVSLSAGANTLSYTVPAGASATGAVARFRLSSAGGLSPTGEASDGEVEDYIVTLLDGSISPNPIVRLAGTATDISGQAGQWQVSDGSNVLFAAPRASVGSLQVRGGLQDDEFRLDLGSATGLNLDGGGGFNSVIVGGANLDATSVGTFSGVNLHEFDLTGVGENTIILDADGVVAMSPGDSTVTVRLAASDSIQFADNADWRMASPRVKDGEFLLVIDNETSNAFVELVTPNPWQNPLDPSDIDNGGSVTAGDALLIINELGRRGFSDRVSQQLVDPLDVVSWPGFYYDQNGSNSVTSLDALRVINRLARIAAEGEGEAIVFVGHNEDSTRTDWARLLEDQQQPAVLVTSKSTSLRSEQDSNGLVAEAVTPQSSPEDSAETGDSWASQVDDLFSRDASL